MRNLRQSIIAIVFGAMILAAQALAQPQDVDGWQQAKWGMTKEEILKAFEGKAKVMNKASTDPKNNLYCDIGIDNMNIAGKTCKVEFCMNNDTNRLTRIYITVIDEDENTFKEFEMRLTNKYGSPAHKETTKNSLGAILDWTWFFPSTTIHLYDLHILEPAVSLSYIQNVGYDKF